MIEKFFMLFSKAISDPSLRLWYMDNNSWVGKPNKITVSVFRMLMILPTAYGLKISGMATKALKINKLS